MSADRELVLEVLAGQSPDYWIFPNAAAFAAVGLGPDEVAETLDELHAEDVVEREAIAVTAADPGADGEVGHLPGGYRLNPKRKRRKSK